MEKFEKERPDSIKEVVNVGKLEYALVGDLDWDGLGWGKVRGWDGAYDEDEFELVEEDPFDSITVLFV